MSENNSSRTFIELLRGRDGCPGRDGVRGPPGRPGRRDLLVLRVEEPLTPDGGKVHVLEYLGRKKSTLVSQLDLATCILVVDQIICACLSSRI